MRLLVIIVNIRQNCCLVCNKSGFKSLNIYHIYTHFFAISIVYFNHSIWKVFCAYCAMIFWTTTKTKYQNEMYKRMDIIFHSVLQDSLKFKLKIKRPHENWKWLNKNGPFLSIFNFMFRSEPHAHLSKPYLYL